MGGVAHLGERLPCTQKVAGSIPVTSTIKESMIEKVIPKFVSMYIKKDPVRPHINALVRLAPGREMYHIDEQAFVCLAFLDRVPADEETLLCANVGPVVVAYTVWSLKKGLGRQIILDLQKLINETWRFKRLVTLSPQTEMATKFHLSNGAKLIAENALSNNFEYDISDFPLTSMDVNGW